MGITTITSQAFGDLITSGWNFFRSGGWIICFIIVVYAVYRIYMDAIQDNFVNYTPSNKRVFLHIKIEKENLQSTLAVEQIFATLHAIQENLTWAETHLEGRVTLWLSLELVSLGGRISYIVSTPEKYRQLVETSFYSQYPNAEIAEVEDYMTNLAHWDHNESGWDLWGTEWKFTEDRAYPIRTYRDFEHPSAEQPIIDPLTPLFEALTKAEPHELMAVQILIRPTPDKDWIPHSKEVVLELKEENEHKNSLLHTIFPPLGWFANKTIFQAISEGGKHHDDAGEGFTPSKVMRMTEGERNVIKGIETKMTKPGWLTKMRHLYIAPKDKFDKTKKALMIGAFRPFSAGTMNCLKPDVKATWTNYNYALFQKLEQPFIDFEIHERKHLFLKGFKNRSFKIGLDPMLMNSEEVATIFHFPLATSSTAPVERIDIKKGQPPANLPIAG